MTNSSGNQPYTIVMLLHATPKWLALTRDQRNEFATIQFIPVVARVAREVSVRFFDSEYFHDRVSDFMIVTTSNMDDYQLFIELLRDTKFYSEPYFEIVNLVLGQENRFRDFDKLLKDESKR